MLLNTKAKTASVTEIPTQKLIFLHLQSTLQKLHCLVTSNSHIACNLLITSAPKRPNSVPGLGENRCLSAGCSSTLAATGETISTFTNGDDEHKLLNFNFLHGVRKFPLWSHSSLLMMSCCRCSVKTETEQTLTCITYCWYFGVWPLFVSEFLYKLTYGYWFLAWIIMRNIHSIFFGYLHI